MRKPATDVYTMRKFGDFVEARSALLHARIEELCRGEA